MNFSRLWVSSAILSAALAQAPPKTILAIGAHAGDMELTAGAVLAHQKAAGDRIVLLHLTPGEGGNPKLTSKEYAEQKRREAMAAGKTLGAEVLLGPYQDGFLPDDEPVRRYVADVIRQVKPTHVITHWRNSIHKDHAAAHRVVNDAVLMASLEPRYRGVRGILFAENWERRGFQAVPVRRRLGRLPDVEGGGAAVRVRTGRISSFRYLEYYDALSRLRGAESGKRLAVAFEVPALSKKRVVDALP